MVKEKVKGENTKAVTCTDRYCPIHGSFNARGRSFRGIVTKFSGAKTISVEWPYLFYLAKYERYEKRRTKVKAHLPQCINIKLGDNVIIKECRPISKMKKFVVEGVI